mgnify:CR=1 FL=1
MSFNKGYELNGSVIILIDIAEYFHVSMDYLL